MEKDNFDKISDLTMKTINLEIARALYLAAVNFAEQAGLDLIELIPPLIREKIIEEYKQKGREIN
jgi:hypothetical protein